MAEVVEGDGHLEILRHDGQLYVREILHDATEPMLYAVERESGEQPTIHDARVLAASIRIGHDQTYHGPRATGRPRQTEKGRHRKAIGHNWS